MLPFQVRVDLYWGVTSMQNHGFNLKLTFCVRTFKFSDWHLLVLWLEILSNRDVRVSESYIRWTSLLIKLLLPLYPAKTGTCAWHMSSLVDVSGAAFMYTMKYVNLHRTEPLILWFACLDLNLKPVKLKNIVFAF